MSEIDDKIATDVMGWRWDDEQKCWRDRNNAVAPYVDDWRPSEELEEMAEVIRVMRDCGRSITMQAGPEGTWGVDIYTYQSDKRTRPFVWHDSLPTAVCLAALREVDT